MAQAARKPVYCTRCGAKLTHRVQYGKYDRYKGKRAAYDRLVCPNRKTSYDAWFGEYECEPDSPWDDE